MAAPTDLEPLHVRDRWLVQQVFIRCCRDSGFRLDHVRAAVLAGQVLDVSPLEVWAAMGSFDVMERVADGTHPAAHRPDVRPDPSNTV